MNGTSSDIARLFRYVYLRIKRFSRRFRGKEVQPPLNNLHISCNNTPHNVKLEPAFSSQHILQYIYLSLYAR